MIRGRRRGSDAAPTPTALGKLNYVHTLSPTHSRTVGYPNLCRGDCPDRLQSARLFSLSVSDQVGWGNNGAIVRPEPARWCSMAFPALWGAASQSATNRRSKRKRSERVKGAALKEHQNSEQRTATSKEAARPRDRAHPTLPPGVIYQSETPSCPARSHDDPARSSLGPKTRPIPEATARQRGCLFFGFSFFCFPQA